MDASVGPTFFHGRQVQILQWMILMQFALCMIGVIMKLMIWVGGAVLILVSTSFTLETTMLLIVGHDLDTIQIPNVKKLYVNVMSSLQILCGS